MRGGGSQQGPGDGDQEKGGPWGPRTGRGQFWLTSLEPLTSLLLRGQSWGHAAWWFPKDQVQGQVWGSCPGWAGPSSPSQPRLSPSSLCWRLDGPLEGSPYEIPPLPQQLQASTFGHIPPLCMRAQFSWYSNCSPRPPDLSRCSTCFPCPAGSHASSPAQPSSPADCSCQCHGLLNLSDSGFILSALLPAIWRYLLAW